MKIIKDILESDILNTLPFDEECITINNYIKNAEDFDFIFKLKKIKFEQKLNEGEKIPLRQVKNFKNKMENWIEDNFDYPFNLPNFYQVVIDTFSHSKDNELISFIILSYPQKIKKMLNYEKNKDVKYVNHPLLNHLRGMKDNNQNEMEMFNQVVNTNSNMNSSLSSNINSVGINNVNNKNQQKENLLKKIDEEINLNIKEKVEKDKDLYISFINKLINKLNEKSKEFNNKEINELLQYELNPYVKNFKDSLNEMHIRLENAHNYSKQEIIQYLLLPSLPLLDKNILTLWKMREDEKIVLNKEVLGTGLFWKQIKELDKEIFEWLPNIIKLDSYSQEEKFKVIFETLAMIKVNEEVFKERLNFLENLGFSITDNKVFAYSYKDAEKRMSKVNTASENELKFDPNVKNKEKYEMLSVADLLLRENNPKWNEILNEIISKREKDKQNKHKLTI